MNDKRDKLELVERWVWLVKGQVQGVGFRPFVYGLAMREKLGGFVRNDSEGVRIECQGNVENLGRFNVALRGELPALAVIDLVEVEVLAVVAGGGEAFEIAMSSEGSQPSAVVTIDTAVCGDCLGEMFDKGDRRYGYGLINCTNCGPRYSIVRKVPYDRVNTTMAGFKMCEVCRGEYEDVVDRRFHAQPTACWECGPGIELVDPKGVSIEGDPIELAVEMLGAGKILAVKGLGGFHLAVRGDDEIGVGRLRELKKRDAKPFALMCSGMDVARELVELSLEAEGLMKSPTCPIVLAVRRAGAKVASDVARGNHRLGVMLPYTPIQHLIFEGARDLFDVLVMTSGNQSDEPLAIGNGEAVERLGGMCDGLLWHDRPIERCVDDSVLIDFNNATPLPVRRARGFVPRGIRLPVSAAGDGICVGGELKTTVAVVRGGQAILSHHIGKLTHPLAFEAYKKSIDDLCDMFGVRPSWIVHDMHPGYLSTGYAKQLAARFDAELIAVQHHHGHAASLMAESSADEEILAVVCDGVGYAPAPGGSDGGEIWGGELLRCDLVGYERIACLKPMLLAGGDAAAVDTRRCALGLLYQVFGDDVGGQNIVKSLYENTAECEMLLQMLKNDVNCVSSSAAGRMFDAIAGLLNVCRRNEFEAQGAIALEAKSFGVRRQDMDGPFYAMEGNELVMLDFSSLVREMLKRLVDGVCVEDLSGLFHDQLAAGWAAVVVEAAERTGLKKVALSGGVFCNQRLTEVLSELLEVRGLEVLRHKVVPANDGGLSLGQAAIGAAMMRKGI